MFNISHKNGEVQRLGVRWFGCSKCGYNYYSKKRVKNHIDEMIRFERCPAKYGQIGDFNHVDLKEFCETCFDKFECEYMKLEKQIAFMNFQAKILFSKPNIVPLMGMGKYITLYEERKKRLEELRSNENVSETKLG